MTELHYVRYNEELGFYEMCIQTGDETRWVPAATYWSNCRIPFEQVSDFTLYDLLIMEGWKPPVND